MRRLAVWTVTTSALLIAGGAMAMDFTSALARNRHLPGPDACMVAVAADDACLDASGAAAPIQRQNTGSDTGFLNHAFIYSRGVISVDAMLDARDVFHVVTADFADPPLMRRDINGDVIPGKDRVRLEAETAGNTVRVAVDPLARYMLCLPPGGVHRDAGIGRLSTEAADVPPYLKSQLRQSDNDDMAAILKHSDHPWSGAGAISAPEDCTPATDAAQEGREAVSMRHAAAVNRDPFNPVPGFSISGPQAGLATGQAGAGGNSWGWVPRRLGVQSNFQLGDSSDTGAGFPVPGFP